MCPSGKVKVFSAGDTCFADGAGTFDAGTAPVAGADGVDDAGKVSVAVRSAVLFTATSETGAGVPGCGPQPARTRLAETPAMATAVRNAARCEFIV